MLVLPYQNRGIVSLISADDDASGHCAHVAPEARSMRKNMMMLMMMMMITTMMIMTTMMMMTIHCIIIQTR